MLPPVCSVPVYDAKAKKELQIMDLSDDESPVAGGKKIILLCDKVTREDIKVRFFDPVNGWEAWGHFAPSDVHKQYAITLVTPAYTAPWQGGRRKVRLELVKPSDDTTSEHVDFFYASDVSNGVEFTTNNFAKENNFFLNVGENKSKQEKKKIKLERSDSLLHQLQPVPTEILIPNIPKITYSCDPIYEDLTPESNGLKSIQNELDPLKLGDNLLGFNKTVENLSGKIESFSLSDAIDTSLSMENGDYLDNCNEYLETRRSSIKRNRIAAALESCGSDIIRPKQSTMFNQVGTGQSSSSLHTPGNSSELNHQNLSKYLTNCRQMNDL